MPAEYSDEYSAGWHLVAIIYSIFYPYRHVEGNFLNEFLGLDKTGIPQGNAKNHPQENNFLVDPNRYDPSASPALEKLS